MDANIIVGVLGLLPAAFFIIQNFNLRKKHIGYKTIQDAIAKESERLTILQREETASLESCKAWTASAAEEQSRVNASIAHREQMQAALDELKLTILNLEISTDQARSDLSAAQRELEWLKVELNANRRVKDDLDAEVRRLTQEKSTTAARVAHLLSLEVREQSLRAEVDTLTTKLQGAESRSAESVRGMIAHLKDTESKVERSTKKLNALMGQIDLYSRVDDYTRVGHFEMPQYLYDTSARYQVEIKQVRERQRAFIREKSAVIQPESLLLCSNKSLDKKILDGQVQLMLSAFNIECDLLIEKVSPANLDRTLEQIEKKAESLEKSCATLKCGFNTDYVELKFEECRLQFECVLKKKEEQDEQRVIREQMREEVRVQKQYEEAVKDAEREESKFTRMLERAREHLAQESEQERAFSLAKIDVLEEQLREAQERGIRAKSMAEQTRRGFVYVISNVGAFGEGIYKIGLTRRLDPQERIDELSSASVPFPFDIHAMCYSEDAPALEHALHKIFLDRRVNAVNFRKEFFRLDLQQIQEAIEEMVDDDVEFILTAKAEDYFQTKRLLAA